MDIPAHLIDGFGTGEVEVVRVWWSKLPEANQSELIALCDRRRDTCFFDPSDDAEAIEVPDVIGGQFVPQQDTRGWETWRAELFDYLICHPEFAEPHVIRLFHIGCGRHLSTADIRNAMMVQQAFHCPYGSETCPIVSLIGMRTHNCT